MKKKYLLMLGFIGILFLLYFTIAQNKRTYYEFDEQRYLSVGYGIYMLDDSTGMIDTEKVRIWIFEGKYSEAYDELAVLLNQTGGVAEKKAEILNVLAIVKAFEGELGEARESYDKALELLELESFSQDNYMKAKVYNNRSLLCFGDFYIEQAIDDANTAKNIISDLKEPVAALVIEANFAVLESASNDVEGRFERRLEEALLDRAKDLVKEEKYLLGSNNIIGAQANFLMSDVYISLAEYKKAEKSLKKAAKIIEGRGEYYQMLEIRRRLTEGFLYYDKRDYIRAEEIYTQLLLDTERLWGNKNFIVANIYRNLGAIYMFLNQDQRGIEYSIKSLEGYDNSRTRRGIWGNMAAAYISLEDYEKGKKYALKAYQAALEFEKHEAGKYRMLLEIVHREESIEERFEDWLNEELECTELD